MKLSFLFSYCLLSPLFISLFFFQEVQSIPTNLFNIRNQNNTSIPPSETFQQRVEGFGYPFEEHFVQTDDGYILRLFRIPAKNPNAPVVIFQHGILASAWCWVDNNQTKAPGFVLAKLGYDVWFTNTRGNTYSRNHTTLSPSSKAFWDYTFADMAEYDTVANVNYVTSHTNVKNVTFVGWSQGTTQMFIGGLRSKRGNTLSQSINLFVAVSPVSYLYNAKSELIRLLADGDIGQLVYDAYPYAFLEGSEAEHSLEKFLCTVTLGKVCTIGVGIVCGFSSLDDPAVIEDFTAHFPAGTSSKDMVHYEQFIQKDRFGEFDYGSSGNQQHYNQSTAPAYDLSTFELPAVALFAASDDDLVAAQDLARLKAELPAKSIVFSKVYNGFSHMTWVVGNDQAAYWLDDLTSIIQRYNPV